MLVLAQCNMLIVRLAQLLLLFSLLFEALVGLLQQVLEVGQMACQHLALLSVHLRLLFCFLLPPFLEKAGSGGLLPLLRRGLLGGLGSVGRAVLVLVTAIGQR